MTLRFLIADSEPVDARAERRASVGQSAGESFAAFLRSLEPEAETKLTTPADRESLLLSREALAAFDGVVLTGSPLHVYDGSAASEREIAFMRAVFASGTPSFGSCAGLQVAVTAAGGTVAPMRRRREAGFARGIAPTDEGRGHPLLRGRPPAYDALTIHGDEVTALPAGATLLAGNAAVAVQAAEIRHEDGVFWGVQYHPELTLHEIAAALRRDADALIEAGLARAPDAIGDQADLLDALDREPERVDLAWRLGVDAQITDAGSRHREVRNWIDHLVRPAARERGRLVVAA